MFDTAFETGLSGTGRLHDMFINIEGMTPGEYKNEGQNLEVNYNFYDTNFGDHPGGIYEQRNLPYGIYRRSR